MQEWWRVVAEEWVLDAHHLKLLAMAARAWDRCEAARAQVARDGMMVESKRYGPKPHPLLAVERDARLQFLRCVRTLGLDEAAAPPPVGARRR